VKDWIFDNIQVNGRRMPKKYKEWGAFIGDAPVNLVGPYAIGDVVRTYKLWRKFRPEIVKRDMFAAYERERKLTPITLEMERSGCRVDVPGLKKAALVFQKLDDDLCHEIRKKL